MKNYSLNPKALLSTLWIVVLFNILFRDIHELLNPNYFVNLEQLNVSQGQLILYALILEIPILMVLLSRVLPLKVNQWANGIAAALMTGGMLMTIVGGDSDDIFFGAANTLVLIYILYVAIKLPSKLGY